MNLIGSFVLALYQRNIILIDKGRHVCIQILNTLIEDHINLLFRSLIRNQKEKKCVLQHCFGINRAIFSCAVDQEMERIFSGL